MATKRPSFLKRQKELKRTARALEKREARKERKVAKAADRDLSETPDHFVEGTEPMHDTEP
jgi:hypothetical protein